MNVFDYISNYCASKGIAKYEFKSKVITKEIFTNNFTFAPGIAFFYRLVASGQILNLADFNKPFLVVKTPQDYFDFAKICSYADNGNIQRAEADFIFAVNTTMKIEFSEGVNALFNQLQSAQLFYIYVMPVKDATKTDTVMKIDIN